MTVLELYFFSHLVARSLSNGIDRIYGLSLSMMLSVLALAVAFLVGVHFIREVAIPRRLYTLIVSLLMFILISLVSYAVNSLVEDNIRSRYDAWYVIIQHFYLLSIIILLSCVYGSPKFCRYVYWACIIVITLNVSSAILQYLMGDTILVSPYDTYTRVAGLSAHPVTFSLEIAVIFLVCEICRRKEQMPFSLLHAGVGLLVVVGLILSSSRTGVMLSGIVIGLYCLVRRPILLPLFALGAITLVQESHFGHLFAELKSVPEYISSGDYVVWDYHTAPTSFEWRIHQWYYLSSLALLHPWFGFGPGQEQLYSEFNGLAAHSQFVEIFFETGVIGLVAYCYFWSQLAIAALSQHDRREADQVIRPERDLRALWLLLFIGITLDSLFDQSFNLETVSFTYLITSIFVLLSTSKVANANSRVSWAAKPAPDPALRQTVHGQVPIGVARRRRSSR
jgi:O-antigen ligase